MEMVYRIEDSTGRGFYGYPSNLDSLSERLGFDSGHYENQPAPKFDGLGECSSDSSMHFGFKNAGQMMSWLSDVTLSELYEEGGVVWLIEVSTALHGKRQCAFKIQDVICKQLLTLTEILAHAQMHHVDPLKILQNAEAGPREAKKLATQREPLLTESPHFG